LAAVQGALSASAGRRLQHGRDLELLGFLHVRAAAGREHVADDLLAALHLAPDLLGVLAPISFELRRQLAGEDLDGAERGVQLVRRAGGDGPEGGQALRGLGVGSAPGPALPRAGAATGSCAARRWR